MEQGEKDYLLRHSNNISNNKGHNTSSGGYGGGGGMNNPFVPSSQTVPISSEDGMDHGFVPIHEDETNGTKLKEMGEHEIYQFEILIQSLSPEKKHSLLYSILQHQQQQQILSMMENLPLTTSTASNNISPPLDSNNTNSNVMNYSYNSESVQSSPSININNSNNNNSTRNIHQDDYYQHEQTLLVVDNNSNDLMMNATKTHGNGNVSDFQSITPIEELWFQRSVSHEPMENESWIHSRGRTPQHLRHQQQTSNVSCSLPNRSMYPQYSMESTSVHRTIDQNMMFGNSFPPSNTSSAELQQLMQAYYRQQFMLHNQDWPLPFEQGEAEEQQLPLRNILSVSKGDDDDEEVEYTLTPNHAVRCSNGNEKANPEKGSWANKANLGSKLCVATTQSDLLNYQRGSSKIRPSSLANHFQGNLDRTTRRVNNDVVDDERFTGAYLPIESDEDFTHQNSFPQCEDKTPTNNIGYSNMVKPVMNQANIGENESFNKQTNNHQTCTFECPTTMRNETYYIPTCQPYVSSFSSCTTETRPSADANPNQSNSSSAHPILTNKKETQPSIGQTSGETLNSPSSSSTRASTTITRTLNNSTNSNTTTAATPPPPVFISGGDNSLNNTSTSITNSTIFRNNVPSVNSSSSIVGSTTTTNIQQQQQQQDVYFYPSNQLGEEQSSNSSGNIEQVVYRNHHAAVMNSNLQFPNIINTSNNCVSYQIPPPQQQQQTISPSLLQQQQNLYILQQHLQNFPQSSQQPFNGTLPQVNQQVNQFPNHFQTSNPPDRHELTKRTIQESNESEDEPYLPKQFSVLPPSSKRRMKRKTTNQTSKDTTIANVPSNTVASLNSNLLKKMTVDMYYDITSAGHPFLPREDLENLSVNDDQRTNLAFMFSLQTLCYQRFGLTKQAHDSFEKAKNLVLFNPTDPNLFNAACTYVNLALYCNSSGDPENAKKFSRILDYNILRDDSFRDSQNPEQLKALIQMKKISDISGGTGYYGDERGLNDVSKFILSIYQYSTGGERPVPPEMMQIARQPLNMETLPEYLSLLDCVMKMMLIYESKGLHFSETQKKMTKYLYYGLSYGMKILLLKLCGIKGPELEEAAEKITLLCRTPTFTFAPTFLIQPVGLALDIHCEMLKEIDQGERSNIEEFKIAKLLRKDIESLRFLNSRYPELCANFNPALEQADTLLEKKGRSLSRFLDAEIYSSNSGGVTIIEDELKFIEGQIKESAKLKRKSREEEEEKVNQDGFGNTPSSSMATSSIDMNLNMQLPNSAGFIPIISEDFPKSYGLDPLTFLSEEDYELLFGEDQKSVSHDY